MYETIIQTDVNPTHTHRTLLIHRVYNRTEIKAIKLYQHYDARLDAWCTNCEITNPHLDNPWTIE